MKKIYLVRHGETVTNRDGFVQGSEVELSDEGHKQAAWLADRVGNLEFEHFLVSSMHCAKQTAQYIEKKIGKTAEIFDSLREVSNPSRLIGVHYGSEEFHSHYLERKKQFELGNEDWQDSDEETFAEIRSRVTTVLQKLDSLEGSVLAVTHGHFLRFLVAHVVMSEKMLPQHWALFSGTMWPDNTGITVLQKNPYEPVKWQLVTWNDHAHFADN